MSRMLQVLILALGVGLAGAPVRAQLIDEFAPPRPAGCCLYGSAQRLAEQLADWNQLGRYARANRDLMSQPVARGRVVFLGDSITDGWDLAKGFPGKAYVNRGIGGQTTAQMLVRFYPDVIALQPEAVVIFAGTNDIAGNNGPQTLTMIQQNIMAMVELARVHGIHVVLCALTPVTDAKSAPPERGGGPINQTRQRPPGDMLKLNAWLIAYARQVGAGFADFYDATVGKDGMLRAELTYDGLHPNAAGYQVLEPVVEAALEQTLR
jgi:lysophospholipase L1-like esterase